ncbi:LOW QUALITY PROTEIN: olfactory receptor 6X1-like, partial [Ciconia boyciana]|uniref:LOW QUALITY PROTEIN: olfactory receptor 6X1-like n=1 Tax=Ciconia boyciana TaxID=52775 RepID=UPI003BA30C9C
SGGNGVIIFAAGSDQSPRILMYFFLGKLSFLEIQNTTTIVPNELGTSLVTMKTVCVSCCPAQSFSHFFLGITEFLIFSVMSFDYYMAIHKQLRYITIMTKILCFFLCLGAWLLSFVVISSKMSVLLVRCLLCSKNNIDHFYCDAGPLLSLACGGTMLLETLGFLVPIPIIQGAPLFKVVFFTCIILAILHIPLSFSHQKALPACSSHLTMVPILYGAAIFMYLKLMARSSFSLNRVESTLNALLTLLLNPFSYTIRNKELKAALRRTAKQ